MKKKVWWITVALSIVLVVISVILMRSAFAQSEVNTVFDKEIIIEDSVASPDVTAVEFTLDEAGEYRFVAEWETVEHGPLTGCVITDKDNKQLYQFTAGTITLQSSILELDEGNYRIMLYHIGGYEQYKSFSELVGWEEDEQDWEEWTGGIEDNGSFDIQYNLQIQAEGFGNLFSVAILLLTVAIAAVCIAAASVATVKGDTVKEIYDERQILVRGRGFKYAFYTMLISNLVCGILGLIGFNMKIDGNIILVLNGLLGTCIYAIYCIWNDGYFALNKSIERTMGINIFIGVVNLTIAAPVFIHGNVLMPQILNLLCGIMMLVFGIVLTLKKYWKDRGEE